MNRIEAVGDRDGGIDVDSTLGAVGEVLYRWSLLDDRLEWRGDVDALLGVSRSQIGTGREFAGLLDSGNTASRHDTVLSALGTDRGEGVPYQIEYAMRPAGPDGAIVWVEDTGRWYAGHDAKPQRAEGVMRIVSERHAREQRLTFLARYDEQTGLFNRAYLLELLDETIQTTQRFRSSVAFLVVAIDDFGLINEAYGFQTGDRTIAAIAQRLRTRLREGDAIGRYSGNKLGLILMNCEEAEMAVAADRFLAAAREDVVATPDGVVSVTVSIGGISIPRHARTREEATERVQDSLSVAQSAGRGRFSAFTLSSEREATRRSNVELARQLVSALADNRLRLAFQPVVDIHTRKPVFHEALLRLAMPDGRIVSAGEIVPLADRLGLSRLFDLAVLDRVLETLGAAPDAILSVNVAPETAAGPDWLARLQSAAARNADIGRRLIVEITESSAIRNLKETAYFVAGIHEVGARLAIDDFGAGFTSFRNLKELTVDLVKIDGGFVQSLPSRPDDQIFVRHLIELAHDLGIETVAEWVRDEETAAMVSAWGVDRIQGDLSGAASLEAPWA